MKSLKYYEEKRILTIVLEIFVSLPVMISFFNLVFFHSKNFNIFLCFMIILVSLEFERKLLTNKIDVIRYVNEHIKKEDKINF